jgi:hypothetical protein
MLLMGIQYSSTISMAMFNSYVCLPEGIAYPHIPMFNQGKIIEVSMVDPWPIKPKKNERAHAPTGTHVPNRNMLENTIFYLIRDDYIYMYIYVYNLYIYVYATISI